MLAEQKRAEHHGAFMRFVRKRYDVLARTELARVPRRLLLAWGKGVPGGAFGGIVIRLQLR